MLSTHHKAEVLVLSLIDNDRAGLPLLGFVLGLGISVAAWSVVGSALWLVLG